MTAVQTVDSHGDEWGLLWYLQLGKNTPVSTWIYSQNSEAAVKASSLKK